jgi:hypothetical protein
MGNVDFMSHFDVKMAGRSKTDFFIFFSPLLDFLQRRIQKFSSEWPKQRRKKFKKKMFLFKYFYQTAYNSGTAGRIDLGFAFFNFPVTFTPEIDMRYFFPVPPPPWRTFIGYGTEIGGSTMIIFAVSSWWYIDDDMFDLYIVVPWRKIVGLFYLKEQARQLTQPGAGDTWWFRRDSCPFSAYFLPFLDARIYGGISYKVPQCA